MLDWLTFSDSEWIYEHEIGASSLFKDSDFIIDGETEAVLLNDISGWASFIELFYSFKLS